MKTAKEIRKSFTDFFASKGHTIVPSAPMVVTLQENTLASRTLRNVFVFQVSTTILRR